ncbi:uncharacterized protein C5orf47 homolog [Cavia porcellus]|uniref:uncharacterized protein C5orf47 homolog n=1 Tax=Cavia porcellus TaxID=10141 RepID=UPI00022B518A|nr:uncharacterized protein C5orf47 homolog [Cavia porcellus]
MVPTGQAQKRNPARFVYVTRFGSHQCGGVLELGGPGPGARRRRRQKEPREAVAKPGVLGSGEPHTGSRPKGAVAPTSAGPQLRASGTARGTRPAARADGAGRRGEARGGPGRAGQGRAEPDLTQKDAAKVFDFPVQLRESCKIMKKRKKISVWDSVYKVISRMLEENENYRLRLNCQRSSSENSSYTK